MESLHSARRSELQRIPAVTLRSKREFCPFVAILARQTGLQRNKLLVPDKHHFVDLFPRGLRAVRLSKLDGANAPRLQTECFATPALTLAQRSRVPPPPVKDEKGISRLARLVCA